MLALASEGDEMPASAETPEPETPQVSVDVEPERKPADADTETVTTGAEPSGAEEPKPAARTAEAITTQATLTFDYRINGDSVIHEIMEASQVVDVLLTEEDVIVDLNPTDLADNPDWTIRDSVGYKEWIVTLAKDRAEAEKVFHQLSKRMQDSPVWSTSSKIGGKVAGDTRKLALVALVTSWVGIVIFIWIRFQKVAFGLAAVVALIHDVLVAVGAIALSYWLAGVFGFLGIQEFKISLTVVVAFLTIVGYSVNDTIVIFDRIREVRGKSAVLTADMINSSINQTLSRTILTSLTTLISTLVLFAVGGEGIHAFAFTLFVGFLSGTYSSIYIATPFVLWLYGGKPQARAVNG
jgi:SecD/SecF fusion protein